MYSNIVNIHSIECSKLLLILIPISVCKEYGHFATPSPFVVLTKNSHQSTLHKYGYKLLNPLYYYLLRNIEDVENGVSHCIS